MALKCKEFFENILYLSLKNVDTTQQIKRHVQQLINGEIELNTFLLNANNLLGLQLNTNFTLSFEDKKALTDLREELLLGRLLVDGVSPPLVDSTILTSTQQQQSTSFVRIDMPQSKTPDGAGHSALTAKLLSSSVMKTPHRKNQNLFPRDGSKCMNSAQPDSELEEARNVPVLLIDSDSETESIIGPDLTKTHGTSKNSLKQIKPNVPKIIPKSENCNFLNQRPKDLLVCSIPISDSESDGEHSNKVTSSSVEHSDKQHSDLVGSGDDGGLTTNNRKVAILENDKVRRKLIKERLCNNQELKKIAEDIVKTNDTCKNSSKSSHEQNLNKSFNKSTIKNSTEKLNVESSRIKENLINNILSEAEKSFTSNIILSDQVTKKRKKQKKKNKEVDVGNINECNDGVHLKSKVKSEAPLASQTDVCDSGPPMVDVTLEDDKNFQENLFSPVVAELVCVVCRSWMASGEVLFCECKLICAECSQSTKHCEDCGLAFAEDKRFSKFHERLSRLIDRPCLYHTAGCTSLVKPGDEHESSCEYKPFLCFKCNKQIPKVNVSQHFLSEHHLTRKNHDVKVRDFLENPESGQLEVCCYPSQKEQRQVYLILNKPEEGENAQFIVNSGCVDDVNVKLLFSKKNSVFRYECDNKTKNSNAMFNRGGLSFIDVSKEAISYWFKDECILDISVTPKVRKRKDDKHSNQDRINDSKNFNQQSCNLESITKKKKYPDKTKKRKTQQVEASVKPPKITKL